MARQVVYVVTKGYDYEGERVMGVASTLTKARDLERAVEGGDHRYIYRVRLDSKREPTLIDIDAPRKRPAR